MIDKVEKLMNVTEEDIAIGRDVAAAYYPSTAPTCLGREVLENAVNSPRYRLFEALLDTLDFRDLYVSRMHGHQHILRVTVIAYILTTQDPDIDYSEREFRDIILSAMYHDLGRDNDFWDRSHGERSSKRVVPILEKLKSQLNDLSRGGTTEADPLASTPFTDDDIKIIQAMVFEHSLEDKDNENVYSLFKNETFDFKTFEKMSAVLKDADALDRFRLGDANLSPKYLRIEFGKRLFAICRGMLQVKI